MAILSETQPAVDRKSFTLLTGASKAVMLAVAEPITELLAWL
jgi:hypothetical protein